MKWFKAFAVLVIFLLVFLGARQLMPPSGSSTDIYHVTDFAEHPYGLVGFNSFNARNPSQARYYHYVYTDLLSCD